MVNKRIEGKIALVTGAAAKRGMGRAIALKLAEEGADVVVLDKYAAPKSYWTGDEGWRGLDEVVEEIKALGRESLAVLADISSEKDVEEAVDKALEKFGKIDILVHGAGIRGTVGVPVVDLKVDELYQIFNINTFGAFILSKFVARDMIRRNEGGKIVHIASAAGKEGLSGSSAYAASKWATLGLVKSLALELAPYKINVNAINPGFFSTNLRDIDALEGSKKAGVSMDEYKKKEHEMLIKMVPLGRMGRLEDITKLILFLVSSESDYMTGQDINITGGHHM
ncbi:MAG: SDR family oxidoreductase [Deltaproteobacteria bacterium]|nr:SDR family oxidoreductase [Deltaproteobacteria bacterium]